LERGRDGGATVRLVRFATVALAAELSGLVGAGGAAGRVVGSDDEEHGRVHARGQTRLCTVGDLNGVHRVLVVAAGAGDNRGVVVGRQADEEAVVLDELSRVGAVHRDRAV